MCDNSGTFRLGEGMKLRATVRRTGEDFVLAHNYTGNATVSQTRKFVRVGHLGRIRKVVAEYPQGWLPRRLEATD